jgi:hypothetical protein
VQSVSQHQSMHRQHIWGEVKPVRDRKRIAQRVLLLPAATRTLSCTNTQDQPRPEAGQQFLPQPVLCSQRRLATIVLLLPAATSSSTSTTQQVLLVISREGCEKDVKASKTIACNIIDEWKKGVQDSDYESIRELSVFGKKQGVTLNALASCIRLNNYIQSLGANANESTLELLIANLANYPDRDPSRQPRRYQNQAYRLKN